MFSNLVNLCVLGLVLSFGKILGQAIILNIPTSFPTTPDMIKSNGYPVESHVVETADGYRLTMHRIPHGKSAEAGPRSNKPVVLVFHGVISSSADWVVIGPDKGLGYLLANEGYDVWLGNFRGNKYSRNHIKLQPSSSKFWDFSFHEMGIFDLPASIDYILNKTGQQKLNYVGHTQGATALFIMLSLLPKYNDLIVSAHALAPAVFMKNLKNPTFRFVGDLLDRFGLLRGSLGKVEVLSSNYITQLAGHYLCRDSSPLQEVCSQLNFLLFGDDPMQLNKTMHPAILANMPAGSSAKQILHYLQLYRSGYFKEFDYGSRANMKKYGSSTPPDYPLDKITAPISLHYSDNDWMVPVDGVNILSSKLSNLIGSYHVPFAKFNHFDYVWAIDVKELVYDNLIGLINQFNNK